MRRSLLFKLLLCYIITISIMFMGANLVGTDILENYLKKNYLSQLKHDCDNIANNMVINNYFDTLDSNSLFDSSIINANLITYLTSISNANSYTIWLLDKDGNFLYNSQSNNDTHNQNIKDFNKRFFYLSNSEIDAINGLINKPSIFSTHSIIKNNEIKGYIVINAPINHIKTQLNDLIIIVNIAIAFSSGLIAIVFLLIYFLTVHPIHKISKYAIESSQGKFSKKLKIRSNDEIKDLADAVFYLTSELNNIDDYQRSFISNISHDFRSPLTSIKGYLEAMLDGTIPPESYEKYIKTILFEAERLTGLTTNLLTLNQLDHSKQMLNKTDFDINYIINKTIDVYEGRCQKNKITIKTNFENEHQSVYADQAKIQQVINNLLDNAIKFSPLNSDITLSSYLKGEKVFISIKDNGQGIPKNSIPHIWDRFFKIDASRGKDKKGTGLGLAITKEIINAHNENINVISTEGIGTEFSFSLSKSKN